MESGGAVNDGAAPEVHDIWRYVRVCNGTQIPIMSPRSSSFDTHDATS